VAILGARKIVAETTARQPSIEEALTFAYEFDFGAVDVRIAPTQIRSEIEALLRRLTSAKPRTIVEIGTDRGGTLFLLATAAADDARLVSVDLPEGPFGGGYKRRRRKLYHAFARKGQRIELLRRDSHDAETVRAVDG